MRTAAPDSRDRGQDELCQYAPLYVVCGSNDKDWAEAIPHDLTVTLGDVTFFMVHNQKGSAERLFWLGNWTLFLESTFCSLKHKNKLRLIF